MELTGSHIVNASAQQVWNMLMNPETLAKVTPGISKLILEKEGVYKAFAEVKMGPVNGKFEGRAEVLEPVSPRSFTLKVQQNSSIGNVSADIKMMLNAISVSQTELSFDGKAMMSGLLARTGSRVMSGVAHELTKQFFNNFEMELSLGKEQEPVVERVMVVENRPVPGGAEVDKISKLPQSDSPSMNKPRLSILGLIRSIVQKIANFFK